MAEIMGAFAHDYAHVYGVRAQGQRNYPLNAWPESPATL